MDDEYRANGVWIRTVLRPMDIGVEDVGVVCHRVSVGGHRAFAIFRGRSPAVRDDDFVQHGGVRGRRDKSYGSPSDDHRLQSTYGVLHNSPVSGDSDEWSTQSNVTEADVGNPRAERCPSCHPTSLAAAGDRRNRNQTVLKRCSPGGRSEFRQRLALMEVCRWLCEASKALLRTSPWRRPRLTSKRPERRWDQRDPQVTRPLADRRLGQVT